MKSPGSEKELFNKIIAQAHPLPMELPARAVYWFVTTQEIDDIFFIDNSLFRWVMQTEARDSSGVLHFLHRVDFIGGHSGVIEFIFKNETRVVLECLPASDVLLKKLNVKAPQVRSGEDCLRYFNAFVGVLRPFGTSCQGTS